MKTVLDFIVIGSQRSGTTSLFEYLSKHPGLSLPPSKEVPYFNSGTRYASDWGEYLRKALPNADPARKWGTVTPAYMYGGASGADPNSVDGRPDVRTVPRRIRERLPDVRLIAILRDPVQRARSHHALAVLDGWDKRSFDVAVQELLTPEALVNARLDVHEVTGYVVFGEYGRILSGYFDVFPREQLLVLFTSELENDPHTVLRRVFQFLGVDAGFVPDNLGTRYHAAGTANRIEWFNLYRLGVAASSNVLLRRAWHALPKQTRRRIDTQFSRINYRTRVWQRQGWNKRGSPSAPQTEPPDTDLRLREHFTADAERLTELLGVAPPWSTGQPARSIAEPV